MDFDEIVVKESPGLCRCCLSEGCYKDMGTEYAWMNENEVYADMLLECFDISISQLNDGPNGPNRLICEVCITRLRDACYFKKQVLESEKKFVDMVGRGEFKAKAVLVYPSNMKAESSEDVEAAFDAEETEVEYLEDEMDFVDDDLLKAETQEPGASASDVTADPLPVRAKRGRPRKTPVKPDKKKVKAEPKAKSSKALVKGPTRSHNSPDTDKMEAYISKRSKMMKIIRGKINKERKMVMIRKNIFLILSNSNVMPFKWLGYSYRCFYCTEMFNTNKDLKNHQILHSTDGDIILKSVKYYSEPAVSVDVSDLSCKLCTATIKHLYDLIDHLIDEHDVRFNKEVGFGMRPYKLNEMNVQCVACDKTFKTFGIVLQHMINVHGGLYRLVCDVCGRQFKSQKGFRDHVNDHINNGATCKICGELLGSSYMIRTHMQNIHGKKYKCFSCPELFDTHYKRSVHMMVVHKIKKEQKCQFCDKSFVYKSTMMAHLRSVHLEERNVVCHLCGFRTGTKSKLRLHMLTHSSERNFKCFLCDKTYKTRRNVRGHFKAVHENSTL